MKVYLKQNKNEQLLKRWKSYISQKKKLKMLRFVH